MLTMSNLFARRLFHIASSVLILLVTSWTSTTHAAEDCVDSTQKLIQYLNKSETQNSPYKIKVLSGTYVLDGTSRSEWSPTASLTIEGGYTDCANRGPKVADQ